MKKLRKFGQMLTDHIAEFLALAIFGAACTAVAPHADVLASIWHDHAFEMGAWTVASVIVGVAVCAVARKVSRKVAKEHLEESVRITCAILSKRQKSILARALVEGTMTVNPLDGEVDLLLQSGLLRSASFGSVAYGASVCMNPKYADVLREHRSDWLYS